MWSQIYHSLSSCTAEKRPGSAQYTPTTADLPHTPQYSCRPHCLPTFPDILNYPEHGTPYNNVLQSENSVQV